MASWTPAGEMLLSPWPANNFNTHPAITSSKVFLSRLASADAAFRGAFGRQSRHHQHRCLRLGGTLELCNWQEVEGGHLELNFDVGMLM